MTEPNKPLDQMTAQERLDLGVECLDAGRLNDAFISLLRFQRVKILGRTLGRSTF